MIGTTYKCPPVPNAHVKVAALPADRKYRAIVTDKNDVVVECEYFDKYKEAHLFTLSCDELYDYPNDDYWVERSTDGGVTWAHYDASEFVAGAPAWTYDDA